LEENIFSIIFPWARNYVKFAKESEINRKVAIMYIFHVTLAR